MSLFRSYIKKNNTLISSNLTNNSQNPVTEISYGTQNKILSRFIFDIDFDLLKSKISDESINPNRIISHKLHLTNTIRYAPQYIGKKSYSLNINRASAFSLDLFNIKQDWSEGSGYEFTYSIKQDLFTEQPLPEIPEQASNWVSGQTGILWSVPGAYISGVSEIIGSQVFQIGNEDICIDVTDYINQRLFPTGHTGTTGHSGTTGYTGVTVFTGDSFGLGIKFPDNIEILSTEFLEAVAFHAKHTNTVYEPYIETIIDDTIIDDRNYFYLDKDNDLYLYANIGNSAQNIIVNKVDIHDFEDNIIATYTGNSIVNVCKGIYKITLNVDSLTYPDAVMFRDDWVLTVNGKEFIVENQFYLISETKYFTFNLSNQIDFRNYYFNFWGINENENIKAGTIRKIRLSIKELYVNQNNFLPLDIEYRLFSTVGSKYELDIIPYTSVNRTINGYEFDLDTTWLIPQDYKLQIRLKNGNYYENKETLSFTIISDDIMNK